MSRKFFCSRFASTSAHFGRGSCFAGINQIHLDSCVQARRVHMYLIDAVNSNTFFEKKFDKHSQVVYTPFCCAGMAELADAHGSGPCESNFMRVQVPLPARKALR